MALGATPPVAAAETPGERAAEGAQRLTTRPGAWKSAVTPPPDGVTALSMWPRDQVVQASALALRRSYSGWEMTHWSSICRAFAIWSAGVDCAGMAAVEDATSR